MSANAALANLGPIRADLLDWYDREHRDFPWRATRDPYAVLVSEVMLQQTQASRVADRFPRFLRRFPTAGVLADAPAAEVLAEWSGLGYNRRALSLQRAAAMAVLDGWPATVAGLERLPGVGPYTARAVASLAFGTRVGVVDTNVRRWLLRRFAVADSPPELQRLADALAGATDDGRTGAWTHATMEFGGAICRSRAPRCDVCPIARDCPSRGKAEVVPVPKQAAFAGSPRARRGALVRLLASAPRHRLAITPVRAELDDGSPMSDAEWEQFITGLEADGMAHRLDGELCLGPPP